MLKVTNLVVCSTVNLIPNLMPLKLILDRDKFLWNGIE